MFESKCPKCKVDGELEVVSGKFMAIRMMLEKDGFAFQDAKQVDTDDEQVLCRNCSAEFSLAELTS